MTELQELQNAEIIKRKTAMRILAAELNAATGLELDIMIRRAQEHLKAMAAANVSAANEEYLERSDGTPFQFRNYKLSKNTPAAKFIWIGKTGQQIIRHEKVIAKEQVAIKALQATAKIEKKGFKKVAGVNKGLVYKATLQISK